MTDEVTEVASPDAGNQGAIEAGAADGSEPETTSPFTDLDEGIREAIDKAGINDLGTLAKNWRDAQKTIQSTQRFPGTEDQTKTQEFLAKVKPGAVEDYPDIDLTKLDENQPFDQSGYDLFKNLAHKYDLQPYQFEGIVQDYLPGLGEMGERAKTALSEKAVEAKNALIEELGGEESEAFIEAQTKVNEIAGQVPELIEILSENGAIDGEGRVMDPRAFKVLTKLAGVAGMGEVAKLDPSSPSSPGDVGIDPATGQITNAVKAAEFFKSDPDGYARMTGKKKG